jgi:hypothetical protein
MVNRHVIRLLILVFAALSATAHASSIRVFVNGQGLNANNQIDNPGATQELIFNQSDGFVSTTQPYHFTNLFLDAAPGILRFDYSAAGGNPDPTRFTGGAVSGEFFLSNSDTVSLSGAPASGFLSLQVKMDGSINLNAFPNLQPGQPQGADSKLFLDLNLLGGVRVLSIRDETTNGTLSDSIGQIATVLLPYSSLSFTLGESIDAFYACGGGRLESCTATASFGSTFQLGGAVVLDSNQHVVPGATITSQTGYDYTQPLSLASTPEPSTWFLFVTGFLACGLVRRTPTLR